MKSIKNTQLIQKKATNQEKETNNKKEGTNSKRIEANPTLLKITENFNYMKCKLYKIIKNVII